MIQNNTLRRLYMVPVVPIVVVIWFFELIVGGVVSNGRDFVIDTWRSWKRAVRLLRQTIVDSWKGPAQ